MRWFYNLKIRAKFWFIGLVNIPFALLIALAGIWGAGQINDLLKSIQHKDMVAVYQLSQTKAHILEARIAGRQALLESNRDLIESNITSSQAKRAQAFQDWQAYLALPLTEEDRAPTDSFVKDWQNFVTEYDQIYQAARLHTTESIARGVDLLDQNNGRNLTLNLDNLIALEQNAAQAAEVQASNTFSQVTFFVLGFAAVMAVLFLGTVGWLARLITRPIQRARNAALSIAGGNLHERLETATRDEIGQLAHAFNGMTDNLALAQRVRQDVSEAVKTRVLAMTSQLSSTAQQQSSGSEEQAAAVSQVNQSVRELAETASTINDLAQQLSQAAQLVAQDSTQIEQITHLAAAQSNRGLEVVLDTARISREVGALYEQLTQNMHSLSSQTASMSLILQLLESISQETHILSLNAAIEAAGLGEDGERFAVIAEEIRNLATRSREASQEVVDLVQAIEASTQIALSCAKNGSQKTLGLEQAAGEAGQVIEMLRNVTQQSKHQANSISTVAQQTNQMSETIKLTSYQQLSSNQQVLEALNNLSAVARQIADSSHFVSSAAVQLEGITREIDAALV